MFRSRSYISWNFINKLARIFLIILVTYFCHKSLKMQTKTQSNIQQTSLNLLQQLQLDSLKKFTHHNFSSPPLPKFSKYFDDQRKLAAKNIILYNRIPKCGSETISFLLNKAFKINKNWSYDIFFTTDDSRHGNEFYEVERAEKFKEDVGRWTKRYGQKTESQELQESRNNSGFIYIRHMPIINFTNTNLSPLYINILRDPTSRAISKFYYERRGQNQLNERGQIIAYSLKFTEQEKNQTIEDVLSEIPETKPHQMIEKLGLGRCQVNWLCGVEDFCKHNYNYGFKSREGDVEMKKSRDLAIYRVLV